MAHKLMDFALWCVAALWLVQHLAEYLRAKPPKRYRRMPAPSILCERTGDWKIHLPAMAKRQAD